MQPAVQSVTTSIMPRHLAAAMVAGIAMMTGILWMPATLGVLAQGYGLDPRALSNLAFVELAGFLLGTLFTSKRPLGQFGRWVPLACGLILAANAAAVLLGSKAPLEWVRFTAGLGSGVGFGYALKACAASERPTRSFGILTASMSVVMVIGFQSIAYLTESQATASVRRLGSCNEWPAGSSARMRRRLWRPLSCFSSISPALPRPAPCRRVSRPSCRCPTALIGLLAILLAFVAQGGIWSFLQVLGISHGFAVRGVANAMSAFAVAGIAGSLAAAAVPQRWPRWATIGAAMLVLWLGLYSLYAPASLSWYVLGCGIGGFYWNFILPLILGMLARVDGTGSAAVLGGTMSSAGSALGPLIAGRLIQNAGYHPVGWMAAGLCLASLICVCAVERRSARESAVVTIAAT